MAKAAAGKRTRVLHISPEAVPFCKVGGLGDVAGSLPRALRKTGIDSRLLIPAWDGVLDSVRDGGKRLRKASLDVCVSIDWRVHRGVVWSASLDGLTVHFLESPLFQGREIYPDDLDQHTVLPFVFLSQAALELGEAARWTPDILHCHDWGTAPLITSLMWHRHYRTRRSEFETVFTIHNLAHQGFLPLHSPRDWGLDEDAFTVDALEFYGMTNLMKGAIAGASAVTTVSPSYAREIQTDEGGAGLGGLLRSHGFKVRGILNGLDGDAWNPARDPLIPANYSMSNMAGKKKCKRALLERCGWKDDGRPVFVSVGRMVDQKGFDIFIPAMGDMMDRGCRLFIVGSGQPEYEGALRSLSESRPDSISAFIGYDEGIAHLAYAGGDFFLMPSKFEPCGLSQLISLLYGTPPVARSVGGLADTVFEHGSPGGNGFLFFDYSTGAFVTAVDKALRLFHDDPRGYRALQRVGMEADYSWDNSAPLYVDMYRSILPGAGDSAD
ncbi:MAG: glycogen synthase [Synergistaceae bacterium]|nr:glycogen/starch synthase [Synergistota bacterium]NLM71762.1 glycogen synthase [Synergistaceae bacterium]